MDSLLAQVAAFAKQAVSVDIPDILDLSAKVIDEVNNKVFLAF
jgi:uncharacterized protein HemX